MVATTLDRTAIQQIELSVTPELGREQGVDPHLQASFFEDFAGEAFLGALGVFEPAAGEAPRLFSAVGVLQNQDAAVLVLDQRHGADHERRIENAQEDLAHPAGEWHVAPEAE